MLWNHGFQDCWSFLFHVQTDKTFPGYFKHVSYPGFHIYSLHPIFHHNMHIMYCRICQFLLGNQSCSVMILHVYTTIYNCFIYSISFFEGLNISYWRLPFFDPSLVSVELSLLLAISNWIISSSKSLYFCFLFLSYNISQPLL
jgi:hypothetical protein